jgi:glycosyltransferase involved in cell wall biosynthesis
VRILLATDHFPPFIGGAHRWGQLLALGLARRGHEVNVVTEWHAGLPRQERSGDVTVHRIRQLRTALPRFVGDPRERHSPPFPDPMSIRDLRPIISACAPDAVLAHGWIASSVALALAGRGIPLLLSAHDYGYFCATRSLLYRGKTCTGPAPRKCLGCASEYYGGTAKGATAVAGVAGSRLVLRRSMAGLQCVSGFVDEVTWRNLVGDGVDGRELGRFIIPPFLDTEPVGDESAADEIASWLAKLPQEPFILFVGAIRRTKGVHVLIEAYELLTNPPPLVLMGTFHEDTPDHFPPGAMALASVPHAAVMAAWDRAMMGVAPSIWPEPCATVSIECLSRGKPAIVTVPGGMADVVGDGAGITVPQGDATALAEAMQSLIEDPDLRERLGRRGMMHARRFEGDVVVSEYERALGEMVEASGSCAS